MDEIQIKYNDQFRDFLKEFNLSEDFDFSVDVPKELQKLIDSSIINSEHGITLEKLNNLHEITESWETVSIIEDFENHFHIDSYTETNENKTIFALGIKTLQLLSLRFIKENFKEIRFTYSFQTPELAEKQSKLKGFHEKDDEYYISDRLSFHRRRQNETLMDDLTEYHFEAVMTIDI